MAADFDRCQVLGGARTDSRASILRASRSTCGLCCGSDECLSGVILTGYEADFAAQWGRKARDLLERFGRIFGVRVSRKSSAVHRWDLEGRDGGMTTAGVGGPITGKGAHLLIVDDPIKNDEEARSSSHRQKQWDWWQSTACTRLRPRG